MIIIKPQCSFASCLRHSSICHNFIFILITALMLWIPIQFRGITPLKFELIVIFTLALLLTVHYYLRLDDKERSINLFAYAMILYGLWVAISTGMHYCAINSLDFGVEVHHLPAIRAGKAWMEGSLGHYVTIYLSFISFFLITIVIFNSTESRLNKLTWIPLIFIPCLLVALYQSYIDPDFLNNRPSSRRDFDPMGGLGTDLTAFRNSLFLIFSLCINSVIIIKTWWGKALYVSVAAAILWVATLTGGRSIVVGLLLFVVSIPIVGAWVHGFHSERGRRYLYAGLVWTLILALLLGLNVSKFVNSKFEFFHPRVRNFLINIVKLDYEDTDPFRIEMTHWAWQLIKLSPIAGWGPGGFLRNVDKIRFVNRDSLIKDPFLPYQYQYAPNQYLEFGNDLGLLGASFILFLYLMPIWMVLRIQNRIQIHAERWSVGIILSTVAILFLLLNMVPYNHFPEAQWLFVVCQGFLISVALKHGYKFYPIKGWHWGVGAFLLTVVFILGVYGTTFGARGYREVYRGILFQPDGQWKSLKIEKAGNPIKTAVAAVQASSNIFSIRVSTVAQNNSLIEGVRLKIFVNDEPLDDRYFFKSLETILYYYVPSIENRNVEIKTEVHPVFKPYRGDDASNIQMTVGAPSFVKELPEGDIGFHTSAKMMIGRRFHPGLPAEPVLADYRWSGMRATLKITDSLRKKGFIYLCTRHPYLNEQPVSVDIVGDRGWIQREWFWNYRWKKIRLAPDRLRETSTLTFKVSRTWNPMLSAVSKDWRDLGVAVALPEFEDRYFFLEHLLPSRVTN